MSAAPMHDVKSAAAVLADDVICQSFIQSSSTLAYACLLIRDRKYDLAVHVLHSLEAKQASRFKDMVFYLQAQIGIETGEFAMVKKRLVPRVNQHPNDMVALSLLECCIHLEFLEWEKTHPHSETLSADSGTFETMGGPAVSGASGSGVFRPAFGDREAAYDEANSDAGRAAASHAIPVADFGVAGAPFGNAEADFRNAEVNFGNAEANFGNAEAASAAAYAASFNDPVPAPFTGGQIDQPYFATPETSTPVSGLIEVRHAPAAQNGSPAPSIRAAPSAPSGASLNVDFGLFQPLANDQNTQALAVWSPEKGKFKSTSRNPELENLVALIPQEFPRSIQAGCAPLDCGTVHKICFSFQNLTVTSFHSGTEHLGIVTGHINQSLLTIVRAENTFRKQAASMASSTPSGRSAELAPNE
jgi:hypothetical protein